MAIAALGVDGENLTGALRLYEGLGFRPHETWVTYRKRWRTSRTRTGRMKTDVSSKITTDIELQAFDPIGTCPPSPR